MMRRRGMFALEAMLGMVLMIAIGLSLVVTLQLRRQVHEKADARQRACDRTESQLIALQNGRPEPGEVRPLSTAAPGPFRWVAATSHVEGESVELIGLVPVEEAP